VPEADIAYREGGEASARLRHDIIAHRTPLPLRINCIRAGPSPVPDARHRRGLAAAPVAQQWSTDGWDDYRCNA
jgi:hypothetical protein